MKKIPLFLIICVLTSICSCKKYLQTTPQDSISPQNYYETEAQLNLALAGVYDVLGKSTTYGDNMLGSMGLDADEGFFARNNITTGVRVYDVSASEPFVASNWQTWYDGINRANLLLANIDKPVMDENNRKIIKGEALFLRAYYHFMLVSNWGPVPLMLKPISSANETNTPRTPAKDVYEQIIKDMTEAEGLVKTAKALGFSGRISKSAVRGILARVCLYMAGNPVNDVSKYADARKWAKKVMDPDPEDGFTHSLNPSYSSVFIKMCQDQYDIGESIWEVEFYGNNSDINQEGGRVGSNNGLLYTPTSIDPAFGYSYGFIQVTGRLFKTYETAQRDSVGPTGTLFSKEYSPDLRRNWAIANFSLSGNPVVKKEFSSTQIYERTSGKWRREYEVVSPKNKNYGPTNFPLLRYSDVLLMFAEADNAVNNGPTQAAIDAVNLVRRRGYGKFSRGEVVNYTVVINSGGSGYTSAPAVTITGGGGSGAIATSTISGGKVNKVIITNQGSFYTSKPTIAFTGGGGSGAAATASITVATSADLLPEQTLSNYAFLTMLQEERSRELCFESLRKRDLVRWGIFLPTMKKVATDFASGDASHVPAIPAASAATKYGALSFTNVTDRDVLWPISPREMGLNKGLQPQNSGW